MTLDSGTLFAGEVCRHSAHPAKHLRTVRPVEPSLSDQINQSDGYVGSPSLRVFTETVQRFSNLADDFDALPHAEWTSKVASALNGEASASLEQTVARATLRRWGAFFTPPSMASKIAQSCSGDLIRAQRILDPNCGAGDLLLAAANELPIGNSVAQTIHDWGELLHGVDVKPEFVAACKARLKLLAVDRCGESFGNVEDVCSGDNLFPNIRAGDSLVGASIYSEKCVILMNPPYGMMDAPDSINWASGKVNAAAVFAYGAASKAAIGTEIRAVLPDVLRSGSRYRKWRESMAALGLVRAATPLGHFGKSADVEVFALSMCVGKTRAEAGWPPPMTAGRRCTRVIGDEFVVRVGPVVDYRDEKSGPTFAFLNAKNAPAWGCVKRISERRRYSGAVFAPPFVVVRRTSRPDGKKRAVGTLVIGSRKVAVENHLLLLLPKNGSLESCHELMQRLNSVETDNWLNERIRCKHLTVSSLAAIPWWD